MVLKKIIFYVLLLAVLAGPATASAEAPEKKCPLYRKVYEPESKTKKPLRFELSFAKDEINPSADGVFFVFKAFSRDANAHVSTLRMRMTCSNGISICGITTNGGQYIRQQDDYKPLKYGMHFEPVFLDRDFSSSYIGGEKGNGAYAVILPNSAAAFHYGVGNDEKNRDKYIKYYTKDKILPNFGGADVWLFSRCDGEDHHEG